MVCTSCGATIADKAIVCYRCGAPTAAPGGASAPPAPVVTARRILLAVLGVLAVAAVVVLAADGARSAWGGMALADLTLVAIVGFVLLRPRRR